MLSRREESRTYSTLLWPPKRSHQAQGKGYFFFFPNLQLQVVFDLQRYTPSLQG